MCLVDIQQNYIFSSDKTLGSIVEDDSKFSVILDNPISVPNNAIHCTLELSMAKITYSSPNLSNTLYNNGTLNFVYNNVARIIIIPDGLYSVGQLNIAILNAMVNLNVGIPSDLISIVGDSATQKIIITFNYIGTSIQFSNVNSLGSILGYSIDTAVSTFVGESIIGNSVAKFNSITGYLIHSSLVEQGIITNNIDTSVIADIPITTSPGNLLVYEPINPRKIDCSYMIGKDINYIKNYITSSDNNNISMADEVWSFDITIRYKIKNDMK